MAMTKSEILARLFRKGDYNVRVTIGESYNTSDLAFVEMIRDSLGGGIIHKEDVYEIAIYVVNENGYTTDFRCKISGNKIMERLSEVFETRIGVRLDISDAKSVRSWVIVR